MRELRNVVVLGASGTIGSLSGGLIAQQGINVHFLSRTLNGSKKGLERAVKQARSEVISRYIECADYEHGLEPALEDADLIIESVSEDLSVKHHMYDLLERYRTPGTIIGTTTSSLPLNQLVEGRTEDFREHFLSTHFYNPPGRMLACEVAKTEATSERVYELTKEFLGKKLRRVVVPVRNIPAFAGNRIAFILFDRIVHLVEQHGVEMMDYLIGPYTGRLMPPLATLDLVGLDVHNAIIRSLNTNVMEEAGLNNPSFVQEMEKAGCLGRKAGKGFYRRLESGNFEYYDPERKDYVPGIEPHIRFVERAKQCIHLGMYREAFDVVKNAEGIEAGIVKDILARYLHLAYSLIGEVTDQGYGISGIDDVMAYGFNWAPPSVLVDLLGGKCEVTRLLGDMGLDSPPALEIDDLGSRYTLLNSGRFFVAK